MNLFYDLMIVSEAYTNFRVEQMSALPVAFFSESAADETKNRGVCCTIMHKLYQVYGKRLLSCEQSWTGEKRHFQN